MRTFNLLPLVVVVVLAGCSSKEQESITPAATERPPRINNSTNAGVINYRLRWHRRTLVEDYEKHGRRNPAWDAPARAALEAMAERRALAGGGGEEVSKRLTENVVAAVKLGCDDPLIGYLHTRFVLDVAGADAPAVLRAYARSTDTITSTGYHPLRKFYPALRAARAYTYMGRNHPGVERRKFNYPNLTYEHLDALVTDASVPAEDACEVVSEFLSLWTGNKELAAQSYLPIEERFLNNWGWHYLAQLIRGEFYIDYAWLARGGGLANTVSADGWRVMSDRLKIAEKSLEQSWKLNPDDPRAAAAMLRVELGQGLGRDRMEQWFQRALAADPVNYNAHYWKIQYLTPQWYGSREEALRFARTCAVSEYGSLDLQLLVPTAHDLVVLAMPKEEKERYWQRPEVWSEIRDAYETFLQRHPHAAGYHHNYARHAWWCKQWDELNRQIPLLGPVNHRFFGGQEKFEQMLAEAKQHQRAAP